MKFFGVCADSALPLPTISSTRRTGEIAMSAISTQTSCRRGTDSSKSGAMRWNCSSTARDQVGANQ
jgi:hypothetical protein